MEKIKGFALTALCGANFYGQIGSIAVLKFPLSEDFGFSESVLGVLDGVCQVGNLFGNICLVFIILSNPKQFFFFNTLFQSILMLGMIVGHMIPNNFTFIYFCFIMFLLGLTKAVGFIPYLVFTQYIRLEDDKKLMGIWAAILCLGDPLTILLFNLIVTHFQWSWQVYIIVVSAIAIISCILWELFLNQVSVENKEEENCVETFKNMLEEVKRIFTIPKYTLLIIDFGMQSTFYYNVLLWFPYYFTTLNFPSQAAFISVLSPIFVFIGAVVFQFMVSKCEHLSGAAVNSCLGLSVLISGLMFYFSFLEQTHYIMTIYMILSGVQGFFIGGPISRITQTDIACMTKGNNNDLYMILTINSFLRSLLLVISLYSIGYFLEKDKSSMFLILLINMLLFFIADLIMRLYNAFDKNDDDMPMQESSLQY